MHRFLYSLVFLAFAGCVKTEAPDFSIRQYAGSVPFYGIASIDVCRGKDGKLFWVQVYDVDKAIRFRMINYDEKNDFEECRLFSHSGSGIDLHIVKGSHDFDHYDQFAKMARGLLEKPEYEMRGE